MLIKTSVKITGSHGEIRTYLADPENWKTWFFNFPDSTRKFMKMGSERGVGAGLKWFSEIEGDGALEIKNEAKDRVG